MASYRLSFLGSIVAWVFGLVGVLGVLLTFSVARDALDAAGGQGPVRPPSPPADAPGPRPLDGGGGAVIPGHGLAPLVLFGALALGLSAACRALIGQRSDGGRR